MHVFEGRSVDDLMRESLQKLIRDGTPIAPSKGRARELHPVTLVLTNPRSLLSRTETRGRLFSALGELCWYLAGTNETEFIKYYIARYPGEELEAPSGYGKRLFNEAGINQVRYVIDTLKAKPESRRAVIQLFDATDASVPHNDIPCTCVLQYLVRDGRLHSITYMRSNDVCLGLPHDLFAFTMLQELIGRSIGVELGTYTHVVASFHLYDSDRRTVEEYLAEGWQSTEEMPPMPTGDPWDDVKHLLHVERLLRVEAADPMAVTYSATPYWADFERLLGIYALWKSGRRNDMSQLRRAVKGSVFQLYISDKMEN